VKRIIRIAALTLFIGLTSAAAPAQDCKRELDRLSGVISIHCGEASIEPFGDSYLTFIAVWQLENGTPFVRFHVRRMGKEKRWLTNPAAQNLVFVVDGATLTLGKPSDSSYDAVSLPFASVSEMLIYRITISQLRQLASARSIVMTVGGTGHRFSTGWQGKLKSLVAGIEREAPGISDNCRREVDRFTGSISIVCASSSSIASHGSTLHEGSWIDLSLIYIPLKTTDARLLSIVSGSISLMRIGKEWQWSKLPKTGLTLYLLIDGKGDTVDLITSTAFEALSSSSDRYRSGHRVFERISYLMSVEQRKRLAQAQSIEMRIGSDEVVLNSEWLEIIAEFSARVDKESSPVEESTPGKARKKVMSELEVRSNLRRVLLVQAKRLEWWATDEMCTSSRAKGSH